MDKQRGPRASVKNQEARGRKLVARIVGTFYKFYKVQKAKVRTQVSQEGQEKGPVIQE